MCAHDADSLGRVLAYIDRHPAWWVLALDYELAYLFEPTAGPLNWRPDPERPLARFYRFDTCAKFDAQQAESWLAEQPDSAWGGIADLEPGLDEAEYCAAVARIQDWIAEGDCYQVNYTWPLHFSWFGSPLGVYRRLRAAQPVRYGGVLSLGEGGGTVSLSPELFLERRGPRLLTRPMKGTAPRSSPAEQLRNSLKDRAENLMIVDLLRNDLGRVAQNGSVKVERLFDIEAYPSVWQMVSEISAEVADADFAAILHALFPCGSITGAPKVRAMQIIGELEGKPRGLYTGALGWLAPNGDFRLNVAIRTLSLQSDQSGCMGVGSGIVADSDARAEWQECLLKSAFLRASDPGFSLIETLRLETGQFPLLDLHLARLSASAACFGFVCSCEAIRAELASLPQTGLWRVRLSLDKSGRVVLAHFPLAEEPAGPRWARLATARVMAGDLLRRHKTTVRPLYDAALKEISGTPAVFDVVFLNERGELAEGARSNVFVERGGVLLTPPVECGALPGVLRAQLLASGQAKEAVLYPEDLRNGFFLGNALRGLIAVRLVDEGG